MTAPPVPELAAAAREVLTVLDAAGEPACLIGGLVVHRWGEPRATTDVDLSVLAPHGEEAGVLAELKHADLLRPFEDVLRKIS